MLNFHLEIDPDAKNELWILTIELFKHLGKPSNLTKLVAIKETKKFYQLLGK
jgi:hypothetical protein